MRSKNINKYRKVEEALFQYYHVKREEHYVHIHPLGIRVRVQMMGEGDPILFIHGGPNAGSTWVQLVSHLEGYQCMLLDRPGCGLSEVPVNGQFSRTFLMDLIIATINGVLEHFKYTQVAMVGSSFGGYWTLNYALQQPERVRQLVLEGCPAMVEGMNIPQFMKNLTKPLLKWIIPRLPTTKSYALKILKEIGHTYSVEHNRIDDIFVEWYVQLMNQTDTLKNDIQMINEVLKHGQMKSEYILPDSEISKITTPTLWLWGEDDPFGGVEIGNRIHSIMKHSEFISFPNSGHLPWLDDPLAHAEQIQKFV